MDCIDTIGEEAIKLNAKHVLIVTDPGVYKAGLVHPIKERLSTVNLSVDIFSEAEPEPTAPRMNAIADDLRKHDYDIVMGIGGGSSIDTAKGLSILLAHGGNVEDYLGVNKVPGPGIPIFALPTTAGTGSEVTMIAVFGEPDNTVKSAIVSPYIFARLALVDPSLTYGCPPKVTAASGMDALAHAIECYTCLKANDFSDALALEAIRLIKGNLRTAVNNGSDKGARRNMSEGALIAGIAFGNSGVTAVHALAYPLGMRFHVPHGVANGLLLPYVMECNLSANLSKFAVIAKALGAETDGVSLQQAAEGGIAAVKALADDIGVPTRLRTLGVPRDALEEMAVATMDIDRILVNNPKPLTLDDVKSIWHNAW
jgi:alcohol dehydrogenase class IV